MFLKVNLLVDCKGIANSRRPGGALSITPNGGWGSKVRIKSIHDEQLNHKTDYWLVGGEWREVIKGAI